MRPTRDIDVRSRGGGGVCPAASCAESRGCGRARPLQSTSTVLRVALVSLVALAGCIYPGELNERPRARITKLTEGPYHYPDDAIMFVAHESTDGDGDVTCNWSSFSCPTPESCEPLVDQSASGLDPDNAFILRLPRAAHDPILVQLTVIDQGGAQTEDRMLIEVANRAPVLEVDPQQGAQLPGSDDLFVVGLPIHVVARAEDPDGDDVTLSFDLAERPDESNPNDVTFESLDALTTELVPDVAGTWRVVVTAADGFDEGTTTVERDVLVGEDGAPCVAITSPAASGEGAYVLRLEDGPRAFGVLVVDDELDPYPRPAGDYPLLGETDFAWQMASPATGDELVPVSGAAGAALTIDPADHEPGDIVTLRVEIADRIDRALPCDDADPVCSIDASECLQRVTWKVEIR